MGFAHSFDISGRFYRKTAHAEKALNAASAPRDVVPIGDRVGAAYRCGRGSPSRIAAYRLYRRRLAVGISLARPAGV